MVLELREIQIYSRYMFASAFGASTFKVLERARVRVSCGVRVCRVRGAMCVDTRARKFPTKFGCHENPLGTWLHLVTYMVGLRRVANPGVGREQRTAQAYPGGVGTPAGRTFSFSVVKSDRVGALSEPIPLRAGVVSGRVASASNSVHTPESSRSAARPDSAADGLEPA